MKQIIVSSQQEFDKIKKIEVDEEVVVEVDVRFNCVVEICGNILFKANVDSSFYNRHLVARGSSQPHIEARGSSQPRIEAWESSQPHIEAWGSSQPHIVAWGSSQPRIEAWESSQPHIEAWGSSQPHIVAWGSSQPHIVAWGSSQPRIEAWESSQPHIVAWGSSQPHIVAWGSSQPRIEAWESSQIQGVNIDVADVEAKLFGFSVLTIRADLKIKIKKEKTAFVQKVKPLDWFGNNGIEKTKNIILFKKVSSDFKTQEGTKNETLWTIGSVVEHPNWKPETGECGEGKFHACSKPYFCDEFRNEAGDKYIAIEVALKDTHIWPNPGYPHKIAFRKCKVLYQCNRYGEKI